MDNKFVHIDHLFKEGLGGGAEEEREGAWLRMKELLDKEMPVGGAPVRRPFRRYWMPALLLLLVSSAGGSYYFLNKGNAAKEHPVAAASGNGRLAHGTPGKAAAVAADATKEHSGIGSGADHTPVTENTVEDAGKQPEPVRQAAHRNGRFNGDNDNKKLAAAPVNNDRKKSEARRNVSAAGTAGEQQAKVSRNIPAGNVSGLAAATVGNKGKQAETFSKEQIKATQKELKVMADNGSLVALQDGPIVKKSEQEITRLAVTERPVYESTGKRSRKVVGFVMDTTSVSRRKEVIYEELTPLEMAAISRMAVQIEMDNIVPMASSVRYANGERGVTLMALSEFKVKAKKTTPGRINEMIGNTRSGIASLFDGTKRYYAALMLGGNASLGNPSAFGLQLGIAGFYALSERWTLGAELKYFNRSLGNYKLADEFVTYKYGAPTASGSEFVYSYEENSEGKYYKIQNFASLELPVTLSYNLGRVSVFGGANLAYGFTMHPLVSTETNAANKTLTTPTAKFPLASQEARVVPDDFKSRFGLGYVFGMTYDLSRSFSLDARVSQTVWDNAAGEMSKQLSNAIFRKPSLQVGLNIYFGRREKVTYILER